MTSRFWTPEEDALIQGVLANGGNRKDAAQLLPHRALEAVIYRMKLLKRETPQYFSTDAQSSPTSYTREEDRQIIRLRGQGFSFPQIAADMPGRREDSIRNRWVKLVNLITDYDDDTEIMPLSPDVASQRLVRRQIETGQYNGAARAAWVARHGDAV